MRTGVANLPLHWGKAPPWLFARMKELARQIVLVIIDEFDTPTLLKRLSDPFWFQALGCALGFDWHSSGLTTTVCGALKEGIKGIEHEIGFFIAGGKGRTSRQTPQEIRAYGKYLSLQPDTLVYASRMAAKVDSAAVQDGYQLYHHVFFFDNKGQWSVIQQGLNEKTHFARRYHWLGNEKINFVCDPHKAVCCDRRGQTLNLVAKEGEENRQASSALASEKPETVKREFTKLQSLNLPAHHQVLKEQINADYFFKILLKTYENQPKDFASLLALRGVGPKTLRALSLLSELVYGARPSFRDPARFSYAHGGKDGHPYPVNRDVYDNTITFLKEAVNSSKIAEPEKKRAFQRLAAFYQRSG